MPRPACELARQRAPARSYLDDNVLRVQAKITDDIPRDILVDEEVLSEGLPGFRINGSLHRSVWGDRTEDSGWRVTGAHRDRKSTRLNSSHGYISYAVFCLKKKKK